MHPILADPSVSHDHAEQVVDLLYESTRDPTQLTGALEALRDLLDASRAAYVLPTARLAIDTGDRRAIAAQAIGQAADAWCRPGSVLGAGAVGVWHCTEVAARAGGGRHAGGPVTGWQLAGKVHDGHPCSAFLFLERWRPAEPFDEQVLVLLGRLVPHLGRVSRLLCDMASALPTLAALMAVDTLGIAQGVVDAGHRLVYANPRLQALLDGDAAIRSQDGRLRMAAADDAVRLERAVATAVGLAPQPSSFCTCAAPGAARLRVRAVPMAARSRVPAGSSDRLVLMLFDDLAATSVTPDTLQRLFDMSRAEARAAVQLLAGGNGDDMAARLGISVNTFKSQLQAAYSKTGTRRRTELLHLLLSLGERAD